jgi:hypothetical protein
MEFKHRMIFAVLLVACFGLAWITLSIKKEQESELSRIDALEHGRVAATGEAAPVMGSDDIVALRKSVQQLEGRVANLEKEQKRAAGTK